MSLTGGAVLFATVWFIVLFVLLPFGEKSQDEMGEVVPGTPPGAPHAPALKRKMVWATVITVLIFAAILAVIQAGWITRNDILEFNRRG
ncbi:MAG TPA: DUF1467 family protein [Paracoccus sp. (in: a-proteobacteria)]|nr:DUF1467 family protein [Paracoccus sp. (in: a-proteobacteria)]